MTTGTAFGLASVSKTLTAAVVLQLVDEGKITPRPAGRAATSPSTRCDQRITVRMLMDHTSGLPDFFLNSKIDRALQRAPDATWTAADGMALRPEEAPDAGHRYWIYSNTNYLLLGELVKNGRPGNPLSEEVRTRLLDPLQLDTAWYQVAEKPRADGRRGYRTVFADGGRARSSPVAGRAT